MGAGAQGVGRPAVESQEGPEFPCFVKKGGLLLGRALLAVLALGAAGIAVLATGTDPAIVIGSLLAFTFGWGWSGLFTFSVVRRNPRAPAASTGVTMTGVYVGANACLAPRIHVGDGAVIAMGAACFRDVPAHHTAVGNPARVVSTDRSGNPANRTRRSP